MFLCALGGTPTLLLNPMDNQLKEVRHRIRKAEVEIVEVKQDLAAAKEAKNVEREKSLFDMLLSLNNQLLSLQEKENILLRSQAPSKLCLQLVHIGFLCSRHVASQSSHACMWRQKSRPSRRLHCSIKGTRQSGPLFQLYDKLIAVQISCAQPSTSYCNLKESAC